MVHRPESSVLLRAHLHDRVVDQADLHDRDYRRVPGGHSARDVSPHVPIGRRTAADLSVTRVEEFEVAAVDEFERTVDRLGVEDEANKILRLAKTVADVYEQGPLKYRRSTSVPPAPRKTRRLVRFAARRGTGRRLPGD